MRMMVKTEDGWVPLPDPMRIALAIEEFGRRKRPDTWMDTDDAWDQALKEAAAIARGFKP